ncbi:MAG: hypothetical protein Q9191_007956 [Dirinaria sp. TL-2023a]
MSTGAAADDRNMVRLDTLPSEILHCIISKIKYQSRHALALPTTGFQRRQIKRLREKSMITLSRLCLVSKCLQQYAESHLYEAWQSRSCQQVDEEWDDLDQRSLHRFLLTIILRPRLAKHVKYIEAIHWRIRETPGDDNLFMGPEWQLFIDTAVEVGLAGHESWSCTLKAGSADPLIALLLTQVPNLQELSLVVPRGSRWPRRVLALYTAQSPDWINYSFDHLRKVSYCGALKLLDFDQVVPCFFLPSVETILLDRCEDKWTWDNLDHNRKRIYYPFPKHGSKITTLKLERSLFKPNIVKGIVRSCPALRSFAFSLHHQQRLDLEKSLAIADPPKILEAISSAQNNLVELKLGISCFFYYHWLLKTQQRPLIRPVGSLRAFSKLSTLDISFVMLLGSQQDSAPTLVSVLPPALKVLKLRTDDLAHWYWDPANLFPHLMALAMDAPTHLPLLENIGLDHFSMPNIGNWSRLQKSDLRKAFGKARIKTVFL